MNSNSKSEGEFGGTALPDLPLSFRGRVGDLIATRSVDELKLVLSRYPQTIYQDIPFEAVKGSVELVLPFTVACIWNRFDDGVRLALGAGFNIERLVSPTSNPYTEEKERALLVHAIEYRRLSLVQLLIESGANLSVADPAGNSALATAWLAARKQADASTQAMMLAIVETLLDARAPWITAAPEMSAPVPMVVKPTFAADEERIRVRILQKGIAQGWDVNATVRTSLSPKASADYTALHLAARLGNKDLVLFLLGHGADARKSFSKGDLLSICPAQWHPEVSKALMHNHLTSAAVSAAPSRKRRMEVL